MTEAPLVAERAHLAGLLEAIQRCVFFLDASRKKQGWPLSGEALSAHAKDVGLFESLSAINELAVFFGPDDAIGVVFGITVMRTGTRSISCCSTPSVSPISEKRAIRKGGS